MMLLGLLVVLLAGGILAWIAGRRRPLWSRWIALFALATALALIVDLWAGQVGPSGAVRATPGSPWLTQLDWAWIPPLGIRFTLGMDGLSLLLVALTLFLGIVAVAASWTEVKDRVGFFHFNLLWTLAGVVGVFTALDLFLFFFFWEATLLPMYVLIALWGHENRLYAALKFLVFTQGSGLLMLVAILALAFVHYGDTGVLSFDYFQLLSASPASDTAFWIMLGLFVAFAVQLPAVPFHTWLADAHTEAPTAASVILAGVLLKTGAYGLIRFVVPLFPDAALSFTPIAMVLGVIGILYGAMLALAQTDLKRLVAYSSVSHLGFVLLGVFAWNTLALHGAVMVMFAHGVSTGALFILVGALQERIHTRDMRRMGGLWANAPRLGATTLFFAVASLGLPGLGNFVGEFLVLAGAYQVSVALAVTAALSLVTAAAYALILVQRTFLGPPREGWTLRDLSARDMTSLAAMMAVTLWLGLYPQPVLDTARPALEGLWRYVVQP